jgi:pimeloyl-ACP methyl ester carboxylesterase
MVEDEVTRTSRRNAVAVVAAVNALAAWGGAVALVVGVLDFGDTLDDRLPFDSVVLAGIALAVVVAIPLSVLAAAAWTGHPRTEQLCLVAGIALIAWIVVQILFLWSLSTLQAVYLGVGAYLVAASHRVRLGPTGRGVLLVGVGSLLVAAGVGLVPHVIDDALSVGAVASVVLSVGGLACVIVGGRSWLTGHTRGRQVAGVAAIIVVMVLGTSIVAPAVAATNVPPSAITTTPTDLGLPFDTVEVTTADDVRLAAWYLPGTNGAAVVVLHGAGSTRSAALEHAAVLHRNGFGVLALDARGHGQSEGAAMDFGWYGDLDVAAAVDHLLTAEAIEPERIGVLGLSMGGEEAIGAAAAHDAIRAVVAEGATARTAADKSWLSDTYGWRGWLQEQIERVQFGVTDLLTEASPPGTLASSIASARSTSFLLITAGRVADERHAADHLAAAAPDRLTVWEIEGADHTGGLDVAPTEWERRVVDFFDDHLSR